MDACHFPLKLADTLIHRSVRGCAVSVTAGKWKTKSTFQPSVLFLFTLELVLFDHSATLDPNFYHYSLPVETKFILSHNNDFTVKVIKKMYLRRQSVLFHNCN